MKEPEVIMHNSISLDGRITGFAANMGLHYGIVGKYRAEMYMAGSNTAKTGIEMSGGAPIETEADYDRPEKDAGLSYWIIPDSRGLLKGLLHTFRRYDFCRDVILLLSKRTNQDYIDYLEERHYDYFICGDHFIDYKKAFNSLKTKYNVTRILVDTGPTLSGILLKQKLVNKISLLVHPCLTGNRAPNIFEKLDLEKLNVELRLETIEVLENDYLHMVWSINR